MLRPLLFPFALLALVIPLACGGDDSTSNVDSGPPPAMDAGKDANTSTCGMVPPNLICRLGAVGKACDTASKPVVCPMGATMWTCPMGAISADQCGCSTSGTSLNPGDPCALPMDSGAGD